MKICHLCLNGPYNEGWNYQENILPKYHVKQGHRVYQIVTPYMWKENELAVSHDKRYVNEDGVEVIRCKAKRGLLEEFDLTDIQRYLDCWMKFTPIFCLYMMYNAWILW